MKRTAIYIAVTLSLTGCVTFENRIACSLGKDKAFVVSEYGGWIGVSSVVSDKDTPAIIEACKK